jgi:hypothetical protein
LQRWAEPASRALLLALLYYAAAAVALDAFVTRWRMGDSWVTSIFSETLAFENPRPIVYRVLTPLVIRAVSSSPSPAEPVLPRAAAVEIGSISDRRAYTRSPTTYVCLLGA